MRILLSYLSLLALLGCSLCLLCGCRTGEDSEDSVAFVIVSGSNLDVYINDTFLVTADAEVHSIAMSDVCEVADIKEQNPRIVFTYPDDGNEQKYPHTLYIEGHKDKRLVFKSGERLVNVQVLEVEEGFGQGQYTRTTYRIKIIK